MNIKQIDKLILVFLVLAIIFLNYSPIESFLEKTFSAKQEVLVERVIDGDTIESDIGNIRLLGINTPERGERYSDEAKTFLESRVFNKTVSLEFGKERHDKYNRTLAYIFLDNQNIDIELVENGFANYYFPSGKDWHYPEFTKAWENCIEKNVNLCEKSLNECSSCIILKDSNTLKNICNLECNINEWKIKAEGRNNTIFPDKILGNEEEILFKLELTEIGDTIFLWDDEGKLIFWKSVND